jgi:hypothetical protein
MFPVADSTAREIAERLRREAAKLEQHAGELLAGEQVEWAGSSFYLEQATLLTEAEARVRQEPGLALSIQRDPLAVSDMIADSTNERQRLEQLVCDIRRALGRASLDVLQADLPREVTALSARLATAEQDRDTSIRASAQNGERWAEAVANAGAKIVALNQALRDYGKHRKGLREGLRTRLRLHLRFCLPPSEIPSDRLPRSKSANGTLKLIARRRN